jgi:hypothetical protein
MTNMASTSIQKIYEHARSARESLRKVREKEKANTSALTLRAGTSASTLAGLLVAGAIDGKWGHDNKHPFSDDPEKNGIAAIGPIPINAAIGLLAIAVGVPGMVPGSEYISNFGAATLGYPLAKALEAKLSEPEKA